MFTNFMDCLHQVYKGDIIYVPVKLKAFLEPWLATRGDKRGGGFQGRGGFQKPSTDGKFVYRNKEVTFYCEDELVKAYKKMPIPHVPEKIMEEAFVIEFTLEEARAVTGAVKVERKKKGGEKLW
ncbi:MAG: hypothetical protein ACXABY_37740 [Candidatus Thorarchaeota archaeon]|jgi:hypothetical protein